MDGLRACKRKPAELLGAPPGEDAGRVCSPEEASPDLTRPPSRTVRNGHMLSQAQSAVFVTRAGTMETDASTEAGAV